MPHTTVLTLLLLARIRRSIRVQSVILSLSLAVTVLRLRIARIAMTLPLTMLAVARHDGRRPRKVDIHPPRILLRDELQSLLPTDALDGRLQFLHVVGRMVAFADDPIPLFAYQPSALSLSRPLSVSHPHPLSRLSTHARLGNAHV